MQKVLTLITVICICFTCVFASAQQQTDSLNITLQEAENLFVQKNLELIAAHYDIEINKAFLQQAKYLDNPVLNTDQNIYDGKFFRHTTVNGQQYGEIYIQLQQLIKTAGKRNKLVKIANDGVLTAEQQFNDVMRNLRYILHTDFNSLHQLLQLNSIYKEEMGSLQKLVTGMDAQLQAGNISQKDNVRVKALLYGLQTDAADNDRQITDVQKELHTLLQAGADTFFIPAIQPFAHPLDMSASSIPALIDSALKNRPDMELARINVSSQQHNLSYQKALAVPDVTAGVEYDRANSYVRDYYGLAISLPLPLFNRNKGNINAAQLQVKQAETGVRQLQKQLEQEIVSAYSKLQIALKLDNATAPELKDKYDQLLKNMLQSYEQRQVGLIEFIDFFEAYKDTKAKEFLQESNLRNAIEELNFTTGTVSLQAK